MFLFKYKNIELYKKWKVIVLKLKLDKVAFILIGIILILIIPFYANAEKPVKKGVAWLYNHPTGINEIKKLNTDTIEIVVWAQIIPENKNIIVTAGSYSGHSPENRPSKEKIIKESKNTEEKITNMIEKAHSKGLNVYLVIYPEYLYKHEGPVIKEENQAEFLQEMSNITIRWAKIAEKYDVEIFSPPNEIFDYVGYKDGFNWLNKISNNIKTVYSGNIVPRGMGAYRYYDGLYERKGANFDFSNWDYIGFDLFGNGVKTFKEYRTYVSATIDKALSLKQKYRSKGIIFGEVGYPHANPRQLMKNENIKSYAELRYESWKIFIDEIQKSENIIPFFWDWDEPSPEKFRASNLIKKYYEKNIVEESKNITEKKADLKIVKLNDYFEAPKTGQIIFNDDFRDFQNWNNNGWKILKDDIAVAGGTHRIVTKDEFNNFYFKIKFRIVNGENGSLQIWTRKNNNNFYHISLNGESSIVLEKTNGEVKSDNWEQPYRLRYHFSESAWSILEGYFNGGDISLLLDGTKLFKIVDENPYSGGKIWLRTFCREDAEVQVDYIEIKELK